MRSYALSCTAPPVSADDLQNHNPTSPSCGFCTTTRKCTHSMGSNTRSKIFHAFQFGFQCFMQWHWYTTWWVHNRFYLLINMNVMCLWKSTYLSKIIRDLSFLYLMTGKCLRDYKNTLTMEKLRKGRKAK